MGPVIGLRSIPWGKRGAAITNHRFAGVYPLSYTCHKRQVRSRCSWAAVRSSDRVCSLGRVDHSTSVVVHACQVEGAPTLFRSGRSSPCGSTVPRGNVAGATVVPRDVVAGTPRGGSPFDVASRVQFAFGQCPARYCRRHCARGRMRQAHHSPRSPQTSACRAPCVVPTDQRFLASIAERQLRRLAVDWRHVRPADRGGERGDVSTDLLLTGSRRWQLVPPAPGMAWASPERSDEGLKHSRYIVSVSSQEGNDRYQDDGGRQDYCWEFYPEERRRPIRDLERNSYRHNVSQDNERARSCAAGPSRKYKKSPSSC